MYTFLDPSGSLEKLNALETASKETCWVLHDLSVRPSKPWERCLFTCLLKHFDWTKKLLKIDLEESKLNLQRLSQGAIDKESRKKVIAFNQACKTFRKIAPRHAFEELEAGFFERASFLFHPPYTIKKDLLKKIHTIDQEQAIKLSERFQRAPATLLPLLSEFIGKGGSVKLLPFDEERKRGEFKLFIGKLDYVYPICHAGLVRSQITWLIISEIMKRIGGREPFPPHGAFNGYESEAPYPDDAHEKLYEKAFLRKRPLRAGAASSIPGDYFKSVYWVLPQDSCRKIFIAFGTSGVHVIRKLLTHNRSCERAIVVIIPDVDWISNYSPHLSLKVAANDVSRGDLVSLRRLFREEYCIKHSQTFQEEGYFTRKVEKLEKKLKGRLNAEALATEFLLPYVYRYAFEYYAHFFKAASS